MGTLVAHTFAAYPEEADKLLEKYQPLVNQEWLYLEIQHLNPVVGINNLVEVNSARDNGRTSWVAPVQRLVAHSASLALENSMRVAVILAK